MTDAAILDLSNLAADFGKAASNAPQKMQGVLDDTAKLIAADMRNRAPKKTGKLSSSITIDSSPLRVTIGPHVKYAVFQEFGTGTRGEFPTGPYIIRPVHAKKLAFQINGKWIFTDKVVHPGIHPHPFARPAVEDYVNTLGDKAANIGVEMIVGRKT